MEDILHGTLRKSQFRGNILVGRSVKTKRDDTLLLRGKQLEVVVELLEAIDVPFGRVTLLIELFGQRGLLSGIAFPRVEVGPMEIGNRMNGCLLEIRLEGHGGGNGATLLAPSEKKSLQTSWTTSSGS